MPLYRWKGIDLHGNSCSGQFQASDKNELKTILLTKNIALLESHESRTSFLNLLPQKKVHTKELVVLFEHVSMLLTSGVDLAQTLTLCQHQKNSTAYKKMLTTINTDIKAGQSLSQAMTSQAHHFSPFMIHIVSVGEHSGQLATTLNRLAQHLYFKQELKSQIKKAALLPSITLLFALIIVSGLFIFVIPQFAELFESMGKPIPGITQTLISISTFLRSSKSIFLWIGLPLMFVCIKRLMFMPRVKNVIDKLAAHLHPAFLLADLVSFLETIEFCLSTGIPLHESLTRAQHSTSNLSFQKKVDNIAHAVSQGTSFNHAATDRGAHFFPQTLITMIGIGEQTGTLPTMITKAKNIFEKELSIMLSLITTLIQPILLIIVGIIIAGLMTALYLPIFNLANAL